MFASDERVTTKTATRAGQEDQNTIAGLKREIEKAWKMVSRNLAAKFSDNILGGLPSDGFGSVSLHASAPIILHRVC